MSLCFLQLYYAINVVFCLFLYHKISFFTNYAFLSFLFLFIICIPWFPLFTVFPPRCHFFTRLNFCSSSLVCIIVLLLLLLCYLSLPVAGWSLFVFGMLQIPIWAVLAMHKNSDKSCIQVTITKVPILKAKESRWYNGLHASLES